ncbi:hypothetical protein TCAL_06396 [Tigriopus californicus]|uniref:Trafficking protein particle complex subunit 13 n=1 Tax=Tigriopus californicus TaxID=6832 RepID=A0A553PB27_TIGCA|nr:trafficking protein particle complex subunit 13-like [Tigriopus californicus]TRY74878.1 hypothetical protein TCAL_06396 [Tigriopus californicus]
MATPSPAAPSTPNMANTQVEHPLALKVMRLTRPTLATPIVITNDPDRDMLKDTMNQDLAQDPNALSGLTSLALGQSLVLPQSFGSIYLGETFTSYVSLRNDSTEACQKVWLNCDLQTSTQRIPLYPGTSGEHPASAESFLSGQSLDHVLLHEVKELGPHILACEVSYSLPGRERRSFRKFFKFQVLKPLDVKTKFYNAESDEVFLEAQVQNVTTGPLCLEQVLLDPSPSFKVSAMNSLEEDKSVFGKVNFLQAQDSRQYLFCLTPKPEAKLNHLAMKGITNIGKLDIAWRTNMGDRGRLQTSQLQRMAPNHGDVRFVIDRIQSIVLIDHAFKIHGRIVNNCDRTLELDLNLVNMKQPQLAWSGITTRKLGLLEPGGNLEISIEIIPRDVGLQLISGIRITDSLLKRNYEFDDVCQVFVCRDEEMISTLGI